MQTRACEWTPRGRGVITEVRGKDEYTVLMDPDPESQTWARPDGHSSWWGGLIELES